MSFRKMALAAGWGVRPLFLKQTEVTQLRPEPGLDSGGEKL